MGGFPSRFDALGSGNGGMRIANPLNWLARLRTRDEEAGPSRLRRTAQRWLRAILKAHVPRGSGIAATAAIVLAGLAYGMVKGDHVPIVIDALKDARDQAAKAAGFRIVSLALSGQQHISREEVLATAGVTGRRSLLFLDVEETRERLKTNPWIADATVLKLYPGELQIHIKEREAFALWQKDGRVSVIAADGTVLEPYVSPRLLRLPLIVGRGADTRANEFLALLDRYPAIREQVRASILVGQRRWNLRLKNGLDVRLPEANVVSALERLIAVDRDAKLLSRDIVAIDLRLPDRVTVRLSEAAAKVRLEDAKDKKAKKPGKV
jgi:cell division protein FtsQ